MEALPFECLRQGTRTSPARRAAGCPFGRELRDCSAFMESPRLPAALDALKCHKSEIMDIFLEIGGCGRPLATVWVARDTGPALDNEPLSAQWFPWKP